MRGTVDADVQGALDSLPAPFRQAVWLRDVEEFSYLEIAQVLDVPLGTVMSRISRGRRLFCDGSRPGSVQAAGRRSRDDRWLRVRANRDSANIRLKVRTMENCRSIDGW